MGSRLAKNSNEVRKRIESHAFHDEEGEEYEGSTFGGFGDYMRRKKIKLQNLDAEIRSQSTDNPQIFRGIVVHVNGYTQPSLSDLHRLIVTHGGGFLQYLDGKTACTHIVASQLTPKKKAEFARYRIVKPAWIVESVNAKRLLPWENYRVVDEGVTQKILGFDNGQMISQANRQRQTYRGQTDTSWYTSQAKDMVQKLNMNAGRDLLESDKDRSGSSALLENLETTGGAQSGSTVLTDGNDFGKDTNMEGHGCETLDTFNEQPLRDNVLPIKPLSNDFTSDAVSKVEKSRPLTAEEHNAILLQNPHMAKSSTANPDFINQYYRESRLHHLSHWKAELKAQLQARALEKSSSQKARDKRPPGARRYIIHVDFDSFFAAVSLRKNLHLIDQPVVVAHGSGPGSEIASCNYPARQFGVKNGMWMKSALEMCPHLKVLPYDFKAYEEASRHFYDSILGMDGIVQSISIDEALIDISMQCIHAGGSDGTNVAEESILREQAKANELAETLRDSVREKTGCEVSVGIGGNILLAKVALRRAKPAGQHQILPEAILDFIGELKVTDLPGVAYSLNKKLEELGVALVKDIRGLTKERLMTALGPKTGGKLWDYSRGIDKVEVGNQVVRKSISAEVNWGIRFITQQQAEEFVQCLCDELHKRLLENAVKGKQLTMKIMRKAADAGMDPPKNLGHGKCDTFNKSVLLGVATNDKSVLGKESISILRSYGFSPGELRGLGVQMQKLEPIKPVAVTNTTLSDGSQRRLIFKNSGAQQAANSSIAAAESQLETGISDTIVPETLDEEIRTSNNIEHIGKIEGPVKNPEEQMQKPLNMSGTQFILPSQVHPGVLAELPEDIRSKLTPQPKDIKKTARYDLSPAMASKSRSNSPYLSDQDHWLPNQSQLDPETLAALPDDVREELLAHYRGLNKHAGSHNQSLLPQSPRKLKSSARNPAVTPMKKHKTTSLLSKVKSKAKSGSDSNLTQSNFIAMQSSVHKQSEKPEVYGGDISQSFLNELPEDIRVELLAEQRKNRMKAKSGLNIESSRRKAKISDINDDLTSGQQTLKLPSHGEIPTFTSRKLSTLPELREAMSAWVQEFSGAGEDGPFEEDTLALGLYLSRVVQEEKDMAKATAVVQWLAYLVEDWPFNSESTLKSWVAAMTSLKHSVQEAVKARGLPPVDFGSI